MALSPEVEQWFQQQYGRPVSGGSEALPPEDPSLLNRAAQSVFGPQATFWPNEKTRQGPAPQPGPTGPELHPPGDPFSAVLSLVKPEWYDELSKPLPGANPEAPSAISAGQNILMAAGGIPNARGSASRGAARDLQSRNPNLVSREPRPRGTDVEMDPMGVKDSGIRPPYRGPRPTEGDMREFERGTGLDRGIPPRENPNLDSARQSSHAWHQRQDRRTGHQLNMAKFRAKKEQLKEGVRKVGEEEVDKEQQRRAERFLYNRARNAPVDAEKTKQMNAPKPKGPKPLPEMGGQQDVADELQAQSDAKVARQSANLWPKVGTMNSPFVEYMQALLQRRQISAEDFMTLMRAKAREMGVTGPDGQSEPF